MVAWNILETAPMELRGVLTSLNQLLLSIGVATSYILGIVLPWRVLALTGVILCAVQLLGLLIIPESPRQITSDFLSARQIRNINGVSALGLTLGCLAVAAGFFPKNHLVRIVSSVGVMERGANAVCQELNQPLIPINKEEDASERHTKLPWMVYLSTFVAVCGAYQVGAMLGYSSPTQSAITQELGLTTAEYSLFGSILSIGAMFGAISSGPIADFVGRKWAMTVYSSICIAGWLGIYLAQGVVSLDLGRLAGGYGIGAFSYVVPVYIAETAPMELRGVLTSFNQLLLSVGVASSYILGIVLPWRVLALTGVIPCVVQLLGLLIIPESPRWLARRGKDKEFKESLQKLRPKDADISCETTEIQDYIQELQKLPKENILELFQRRYLQSILIGVGLMGGQELGGISGICFYISDTFESAGVSSTVGSISYSVIQVLVNMFVLPLIDKVGRKPLTMVSALGLTLGCLTAAAGFFLKAHGLWVKAAPVLALVGLMVFIASYSAGMGPVPWIMLAEIFPLNVKGTGGSIATLVHWFCSWAVSYTFNMLTSWSSYGTFLLYAAVNALAFIFVMKAVPETKRRTLEQIQSEINI